MSGGGYSGLPRVTGTSRCGTLSFRTTLASVDPVVLAKVQPGTICKVVLTTAGDVRRIAVVLQGTGERLGSVLENWTQLVECLAAGFSYTAEVIEVGAPCVVLIQPDDE